MENDIAPHNPESEIILYTNENGTVQMDVRIDGKTVWLTQQQMAQLFGKATSTINEHIKNILAEEELKEEECVKKFGISEFQQKAPFCQQYKREKKLSMSTINSNFARSHQ